MLRNFDIKQLIENIIDVKYNNIMVFRLELVIIYYVGVVVQKIQRYNMIPRMRVEKVFIHR